MQFTPLTPDRLVADLAAWIDRARAVHPLVGVDGDAEIGATDLADAVAVRVRSLGRPVIRVSTSWWLRPVSLRLELGRSDVDMLLGGWVDAAALRRELFGPLEPGGTGRYLRRLRDPNTDRSVRETRILADERAAVLLDGPFLRTTGLPLDAVVHLQVSPTTLARSLPLDRQWWREAFGRYLIEYLPVENAVAVIAYDHPAAPAIAWPATDPHGVVRR